MGAETSNPCMLNSRRGTPSPPSGIGVESKRVRFSDTVEEFESAGGQERAVGEAARDRHRFARRCSGGAVVARCLARTPSDDKGEARGPDLPTQDPEESQRPPK
ncbi:hypothetical protein Q5P01_000689 [Channa striata]|uniref:Uncharacterized protein n=1 Tax=Channa striata TaxID=64152 RepID=A0AA88LMZ4_CHASR|nr:hypothetical protein Q5P01_000689 [Channa striata]